MRGHGRQQTHQGLRGRLPARSRRRRVFVAVVSLFLVGTPQGAFASQAWGPPPVPGDPEPSFPASLDVGEAAVVPTGQEPTGLQPVPVAEPEQLPVAQAGADGADAATGAALLGGEGSPLQSQGGGNDRSPTDSAETRGGAAPWRVADPQARQRAMRAEVSSGRTMRGDARPSSGAVPEPLPPGVESPADGQSGADLPADGQSGADLPGDGQSGADLPETRAEPAESRPEPSGVRAPEETGASTGAATEGWAPMRSSDGTSDSEYRATTDALDDPDAAEPPDQSNTERIDPEGRPSQSLATDSPTVREESTTTAEPEPDTEAPWPPSAGSDGSGAERPFDVEQDPRGREVPDTAPDWASATPVPVPTTPPPESPAQPDPEPPGTPVSPASPVLPATGAPWRPLARNAPTAPPGADPTTESDVSETRSDPAASTIAATVEAALPLASPTWTPPRQEPHTATTDRPDEPAVPPVAGTAEEAQSVPPQDSLDGLPRAIDSVAETQEPQQSLTQQPTDTAGTAADASDLPTVPGRTAPTGPPAPDHDGSRTLSWSGTILPTLSPTWTPSVGDEKPTPPEAPPVADAGASQDQSESPEPEMSPPSDLALVPPVEPDGTLPVPSVETPGLVPTVEPTAETPPASAAPPLDVPLGDVGLGTGTTPPVPPDTPAPGGASHQAPSAATHPSADSTMTAPDKQDERRRKDTSEQPSKGSEPTQTTQPTREPRHQLPPVPETEETAVSDDEPAEVHSASLSESTRPRPQSALPTLTSLTTSAPASDALTSTTASARQPLPQTVGSHPAVRAPSDVPAPPGASAPPDARIRREPPAAPTVDPEAAVASVPERVWASGLVAPGGRVESVQSRARQRQRVPDVVVADLPSGTWEEMARAAATLTRELGGADTRVSWRVPVVPTQVGLTAADVVSGATDERWAELGRAFARTGGGEFILSPTMGADVTPAVASAAFRRAVTAAKTEAPRLVAAWSPSSGTTVAAAERAFPGPDVVDILAISVSDDGRPWSQVVDGPDGLNAWLDLANRHGKRLALRWSSSPSSDVAWIRNMRNWIRHAAEHLAYEAYDGSSASAPSSVAYNRMF